MISEFGFRNSAKILNSQCQHRSCLGRQKEALLFFGNRKAEAFHDGEEVVPDETLEGQVLIVEEVAGVKGGANGNAIQLHPRSAKARDSIFLGTEEAFDR